MSASPGSPSRSTQQFGDTEAARRNLTAVRTTTAAIGERQKALQTLAAQRRPELVPELSLAMDDAALRIDAIRAIAAFDDESLGKLLVTRFQTFNAAEKTEAVQTLASRGRYGRMLTDALASGAIAKRDVPPHAARQLRRVVGVRFADVWGPIDENAGEDRAYARYRGMLTDSAIGGANLSNGRATFQRTCGPCHKLYGEGGAIGPDLDGLEPRQPGIPPLERPQSERRGSGRLQDGHRHHSRWAHILRKRRRLKPTASSRCALSDAIRWPSTRPTSNRAKRRRRR